ncbi:nucleotidyltransferase domain-containing protein [Nocardia nova]|uniref:nucleotidyltransferase domain-containing protein n=1 Tax=Nocardia nova TaxID=37330 RepID=UPI00340EEDB9
MSNVTVRGVVHDSGGCTSPGAAGMPFDVDVFGALLSLSDVEEIVVFGSWIRRLLTNAGPDPRDLDILVVGSVNRRVAYEEIRSIEMHVGLPVDSIFVLPEDIVDKTDPFLDELFTSPHIHLEGSPQKWT